MKLPVMRKRLVTPLIAPHKIMEDEYSAHVVRAACTARRLGCAVTGVSVQTIVKILNFPNNLYPVRCAAVRLRAAEYAASMELWHSGILKRSGGKIFITTVVGKNMRKDRVEIALCGYSSASAVVREILREIIDMLSFALLTDRRLSTRANIKLSRLARAELEALWASYEGAC
jgi:hypothetical protein